MKKILKPLALLLLTALIIIQFFRPKENLSSGSTALANDISKVYHVPDQVQAILQTSCYDCHSNNTQYPWYSKVQPVTWWLNDHILEGKKEINFSEFASYSIRRKYKKMEEIIKQVKDDEMPLYSYIFIHRNSKLNGDQKLSVVNWATAIRDTMKASYPADSLIKK
ncbi:MAG: heme-binding domain-containing protein [Ferruginibacter sp.]|nr:heme-binding domain-containing protein [Ferruginibacter sp.]